MWTKEQKLESVKRYYATPQGEAKRKAYYQSKKDEINKKAKEYYKNNKKKINSKKKEKRNSDIKVKISDNLRNRLRQVLKSQKTHKDNKTMTYIGCTKQELVEHLESQFTGGMNWKNYGDWHIDHIYPMSQLDLSIEENIFKVMHYTNLQPLWAEENISKSGKLNF